MTTFPALQPGSRAFVPGTYPGATFRTISGRDSRARHSNAVVEMQVKAVFPLLNETELELIRSHYVGQYGGHQSFAVPDEFWSGADAPAGFTPSGYQWRYAGKPSIEEITTDTSGAAATLFNVSIELEAVPPRAVVFPGATFNITTTWLPGLKSVSATGATWDVAVSWVPGSSSTWGPGVDPYFTNVSLLLNGNAFTDLSSNALTVTPQGNAAIVAGQGPFGDSAMAFDGTGDYLTIPANNAFEFGSSDLTWEFWVKTTTTTRYATIYSRTPSGFASGMWTLMINWASNTAGDIALYVGDYSTSGPLMQTAAVNLRDNAWHFITVSRNGSAWSIAIDGTSRVSATFSGSIATLSAANYVGRDQNYIRDFSGLIGPLRITKSIARAITVPTEAFPTA